MKGQRWTPLPALPHPGFDYLTKNTGKEQTLSGDQMTVPSGRKRFGHQDRLAKLLDEEKYDLVIASPPPGDDAGGRQAHRAVTKEPWSA